MSAVDAVAEALATVRRQSIGVSFALGEVTTLVGTGVTVKFDGETSSSGRTYTRLGSYTAVVADRVLLAKVGSTWVVVGKVVTLA